MPNDQLHVNFVEIFKALDNAKINYKIIGANSFSFKMLITVPGERWVSEYFYDGKVKYERFTNVEGNLFLGLVSLNELLGNCLNLENVYQGESIKGGESHNVYKIVLALLSVLTMANKEFVLIANRDDALTVVVTDDKRCVEVEFVDYGDECHIEVEPFSKEEDNGCISLRLLLEKFSN